MAKLIKREARGSFFAAPQTSAPQQEVQPAEILDAKEAAEKIELEAAQKAEEMRQQAAEAAELLRKDAAEDIEAQKKEGFEQGFAAGKQEGLELFAKAIAQASKRGQQVVDEVVPQLTTLAMRICRRILGRELEFHPETVVEIVKQALGDKARTRREITLRVHPSDAQTIRDNRKELIEMLARTKEIAIREDENVAKHGVIIETEAGVIDAQLDTQLAVFEQVLGAKS